MSRILQKTFSCLTCGESILLSKIDNPAPGSKKRWEQWELDSVTPHQCKKEEQKQQKQEQQQSPSPTNPGRTSTSTTTTTPPTSNNTKIANEISQIKAELRVNFEHIIMRLDKIQSDIIS
jgi:hypothetical protein